MPSYVKTSVAKPAGMPGRALNTKDRLIIIDVDDIDTFPPRTNGVAIESDITMKEDTYAVTVYLTPGTAVLQSNSEGDPDAQGFKPSVEFSHPGNSLDAREFKANWLGKNCVVLLESCQDGGMDIIGSPCNPCQMAVEYTGNNEGNANKFTFAQVSKGDDIGIYRGAVTFASGASGGEGGGDNSGSGGNGG